MDGRLPPRRYLIWRLEAAQGMRQLEHNEAAQKINALFCDLHVETMTFGPTATGQSFKD